MGFYIRKSIKFGPFRINFSKSGVGFSAGVKGARISKGPRGTFVHLGQNGVYYKQSLSNRKSKSQSQVNPANLNQGEPIVQLDEIKTTDVLGLVDSSFEEAFKTIQENYARLFFGEKKIYLFYDIDEEQVAKAEKFYSIIKDLKCSWRYWHLNAQTPTSGAYSNKKFFGGADVVNKSFPISSLWIHMGKPRRFITNVKALVLPLIGKKLYFFPDRLFITQGRKIGTVNYNDLIVEYGKSPTVMSPREIPFGTKTLGSVWRYANKDGSPDKRYSSRNYQLPIADLSQLNLKSDSGLNESVQFSRGDLAEYFAKALLEYSHKE